MWKTQSLRTGYFIDPVNEVGYFYDLILLLKLFQRKKSIANFVIKNDVNPPKHNRQCYKTEPCCSCKVNTCHLLTNNESSLITNHSNGKTTKIKNGGNCKSKDVVYAARCKIHGSLYIGQTGSQLRDRFSKHRYDFKRRPENNELTAHFHHHNHDFEKTWK